MTHLRSNSPSTAYRPSQQWTSRTLQEAFSRPHNLHLEVTAKTKDRRHIHNPSHITPESSSWICHQFLKMLTSLEIRSLFFRSLSRPQYLQGIRRRCIKPPHPKKGLQMSNHPRPYWTAPIQVTESSLSKRCVVVHQMVSCYPFSSYACMNHELRPLFQRRWMCIQSLN